MTGEVSQISQHLTKALKQRSPTFLAPGTSFMEDSFFTDWGRSGGQLQGNSSALHLLGSLFLLLLHQLHPQSSGIRSQSLGTPALKGMKELVMLLSEERTSRLWFSPSTKALSRGVWACWENSGKISVAGPE